MKKPDKIYIHIGPHLRQLTTTVIKTDTLGEEEYIRKDALLEWLEYKKEWFEGTDIEPHYQKVIDKLNSL